MLDVERPGAHLVDQRVVEALEREQRVARAATGPRPRRRRCPGSRARPAAGWRGLWISRSVGLGDDRRRSTRCRRRARATWKPALRQQLVEVVAADPARDVRVARRGPARRTGRRDRAQRRRGPRPAARRRRSPRRPRRRRRRPRSSVVAAVGHDASAARRCRRSCPAIQRVAAARVVADHPAERAPGVGRRVRAERQAVRLRGAAQVVEDDARLDAGRARHRVQLEDRGHVPAECRGRPRRCSAWPARLVPAPRASTGASNSAHTRSAATTSSWSSGKTTPERDLAVVRRVGRVDRARRARRTRPRRGARPGARPPASQPARPRSTVERSTRLPGSTSVTARRRTAGAATRARRSRARRRRRARR